MMCADVSRSPRNEPSSFVRTKAQAGTMEKKPRMNTNGRAAGAGPKGELPGVRSKLFLILFYLKAYPTQGVIGHFFNLSQPQVCACDLAQVLGELPAVNEVLIDGTERPR